MIGRIITGIFLGFFLRIFMGAAIVILLIYYFIFQKIPFASLPNDLWQKVKGTTVQVSVGQNGVTNKYDVLTEKTMAQIDSWLAERGFNQYGDPKDTVYAGGSPTFNEKTGESQDRYQLVMSKHPELKKIK
jgi:hypothetical protein